jgi:hypothetical protein
VRDPILHPPGEHAREHAPAKDPRFATVPDPSDVQGTLRWWDEYRARERARLSAMQVETHEHVLPSGRVIEMFDPRSEVGRHFGLVIDVFPTEAEIARAHARQAALQAVLDAAQRPGPTPKETTWQKLRRWVGNWKRSATSGARSARRTRGTPPTAR